MILSLFSHKKWFFKHKFTFSESNCSHIHLLFHKIPEKRSYETILWYANARRWMIEIQMYANVHDVKRMELNSLQPRKLFLNFLYFIMLNLMLLCRAVPRRQSHREWPRDNRSSKQRLVTIWLRNICAGKKKKNCRFVWWTLGKNLQKFFECWISRTAQSYAWIYLHHRKKARYVCMSSILIFLCFKRLTIDT